MKTYSAKPADITRKWYVLDASTMPLGRLSTRAASLLLGKGKPQVTAHIDCGDYVIIVNAGSLKVTGDKLNTKKYYRHSGYAGNLHERTLAEQMLVDPTEVIFHAVRGMLPVNKLRDGRLERLKIYAGAEHNHEAQKPETVKEAK
ncbi:MAG TPA: 50S ribosomal protein L13 [Candidatus Saccharimonadales bacterium]|nr:50S ribosomal protein L13 [Candidatus Saccharimonadales bacterium]